jgi:hypothetical protein
MDWRDIIYGLLFLFLLYILFAHTPGGGSHGGKDKHDDKGGKDAHRR